MQGTDVPTLFLETIDPEFDTAALAWIQDDREPSVSSRAMDAPPLRYDVASLQHWLDLNA